VENFVCNHANEKTSETGRARPQGIFDATQHVVCGSQRLPHHEDRTPTHGYESTREAAMLAFAKSWRRE
jgi:hypothetical protein